MYSPRARNAANAIASEVLFWRLLGLQAVLIYGFVAIALGTGLLSIRDPEFDAALTTITAIFASNLLFMPQSQEHRFEHCRIKRKRWSNAAYRFSGQWIRRRQATLRRARSLPQRFRTSCSALEAFSIWIHRQSGGIAAAPKVESRTYEGASGVGFWGGFSFRSSPRVSQRGRRARRGSRFLLRSCSIRSPQCHTYGTPGDIALRGSFILLGQAAVRWHVVAFHLVPAVLSFIARLALYCLLGAIHDAALAVCWIVRLLQQEAEWILLAARSLCRTRVFWQVLFSLTHLLYGSPAFTCVLAVFGFLAQFTLYAVADILQIAGRCCRVVQCTLGVVAAIATRRTRIDRNRSGSPWKLRCRGSGFRNLFLSIFVLFLLGGFLLEGNPPRTGTGLQAPPLHAGGADPPLVRCSERLASSNSIGSTLRRSIEPDENRTYVQRWPTAAPEVAVRSVPEVSIADPNSPPQSPEADAVEAEVLDRSCDVLNLMRSLDGEVSDVVQGHEVFRGHRGEQGGNRSQTAAEATVDLEKTQPYLEFSAQGSDEFSAPTLTIPAPGSDRCSDSGSAHLSRDGGGGGASDVVDVDSGVENTQEPCSQPGPAGRERKSAAKAKAKPAAQSNSKSSGPKLKWVPKSQPGVRGIAEAWATLDSISLKDEWKHQCATVREVPEFFSRAMQEAFYVATSRIRDMHIKGKELELERAWKLFLLLPRMLLSRTRSKGDDGKSEFFDRFRAFHRGDWVKLVQQARLPKRKKKAAHSGAGPGGMAEARLRAAEQRARLGEISHARQELVGMALAPRTMETYWKLCDHTARPQEPRSADRLRNICAFVPQNLLELDYGRFLSNVRSAPRGKSGGLSGMRNEHLKNLVFSPRIEDAKALYYVANSFARAEIPESIRKGLALARMTALDKGCERVRGIAAGDTFRRVVAKTLAQQHASEFDDACSPFQFALSTRAGTDCVGHGLRELTNQYPDKVVASLDGISAYDHIDRAQMLESLAKLPNASSLLPFVAMFYGHTSEYYWTDADGEVWSIDQGDGGEQGDPLMPALFALGQHPALVAAEEKLAILNFDECSIAENFFTPLLFAFLDDLYVVCNREIARKAFDIVTAEVASIAGIRTNLGKLQLYSKAGGPCPPGFEDFQALRGVEEQPIWTCDAHEISKRGIVVLGSPLGTVEFCTAFADKRMKVEQELLDWIPKLPTLQVAWLLLYYSAAQRANHLIRLLPPSLSVEYAEKHDSAILKCLEILLQAGPLSVNAKRIASLRCVNGGLGLRSARRTAQAAFWAAWADALPMLHRRIPVHAEKWSEQLEFAQANIAHVEFLRELPCGLQEAELARRQLLADGFHDCPTWEDIRAGVLPKTPDPLDSAPGEWSRGWQYYASRARDNRFLEFEVRPHLSPTEQALLLSQGGPFASQYLQALPTKLQLELENQILNCLLRRRLRMPLVDGLRCCPASSHGSGKTYTRDSIELDIYGDHLASCMRTGRVQRRANILEKIWMQVFYEAGGMIVPNEKLRHMRIGVDPEDKRRVEFAVYNLRFGPPLLCDCTQVSPVGTDGMPHPNCAVEAGAALRVAEERKATTYQEAEAAAGRVRLETLACEVGGRWSQNCITWIGKLAKHKASGELFHLRRATEYAWYKRWWSLLSVAAQRAFALSLIEVDCDAMKPLADFEPKLGDVLADVRYELGPTVSRLPLRG